MNYFNMTMKTYTYKPKNEPNISFAGTTENYIFTSTPSYVGLIPVYETAVAGSLHPSDSNISIPGSLDNAIKKD